MVCIELLHCLRVTVVPPFPPEYESDSADCRLRKEFPETFVQFEDRKLSIMVFTICLFRMAA